MPNVFSTDEEIGAVDDAFILSFVRAFDEQRILSDFMAQGANFVDVNCRLAYLVALANAEAA